MRCTWLVALLVCLIASPSVLAHEEDGTIDGSDLSLVVTDVPCFFGRAGDFPCRHTNLLAWFPPGAFGRVAANDIWGWTHPESGREYAIMGMRSATVFVDVTNPTDPIYQGFVPTHTVESVWRDIKTYAGHAFIVSEAADHGMQIVDLVHLSHGHAPPVQFEVAAHYDGFGSAHNIAINEATGMAYVVGTNTCRGGLHMVDISEPTQPVFAGCFDEDGYTHDAQCVVYQGPDREHREREICIASNEDTVTIVDVTDREAPRMLSRTSYAGVAYTHQAWLTEDHQHLFVDDELDEKTFLHRVFTYVFDVSDLDAPVLTFVYGRGVLSSDHNQYVVGDQVFQANYTSGLRVIRTGDLSRGEMEEVGFFDTTPTQTDRSFRGAWSVYPFFESGIVVVSDIRNGLFVLRPLPERVPHCLDGLDNDLDGLGDAADPACTDPTVASELPRHDVAIDVRPGNPDNAIKIGWAGRFAVAVLGAPEYSVRDVDGESLRFGPRDALPVVSLNYRDTNDDGVLDLIAKFRPVDTGIEAGDPVACLRWRNRDATPFEACDAIRTIPTSD